VFHDRLAAMRTRGDLTDDADPRTCIALLAAIRRRLLTYATGAQNLRANDQRSIDYVGSFRTPAKRRTPDPCRGPKNNPDRSHRSTYVVSSMSVSRRNA